MRAWRRRATSTAPASVRCCTRSADVPQRSLFKLVCVGDARRVVGIHLMGEAADEILQGFAVAMKRGITLEDLRDTVAIHPTSAEEVVLMR